MIRVRFRRDGHEDGGRFVPAYSEDLDLDELTPRARVLAEALHQSMQPGLGLPHRPLEVLFETDVTNGELAKRPPVRPDAYGPVKDADQKAQRVIDCGPSPEVDEPRHPAGVAGGQGPHLPAGLVSDRSPQAAPHPVLEDAAADRYLAKEGALDFLREHDAELSITAWDTLRGTDMLTPDSHCVPAPPVEARDDPGVRRPGSGTVAPPRVAEFLGLTPGSARVQMRRWDSPRRGAGRDAAGRTSTPPTSSRPRTTTAPGEAAGPACSTNRSSDPAVPRPEEAFMPATTIGFGLDHVIHHRNAGWQGGMMYGAAVPGAIDGLKSLLSQPGKAVFVISIRENLDDIVSWLEKRGVPAVADDGGDHQYWQDETRVLVTRRMHVSALLVYRFSKPGRGVSGWSDVPDAVAELY